ncbi:sulfate ABC transporter permease subunit CysW [Nodularia harveyana UHCC-0300]|uniref:Sulfate ABC transporter permease subunit CysW n=1 Tax=Nodularia harveyana UHCC-0300 TaxID=2974287 RepID=A0ABU5UDK3_9CYAN|nr:sulfate ABC transporter permease subunit CysW [Nodularia harveyana]MEA5581615.1 sulfate ABC transporter permease subunit CysW [Nodularia harveyana UHCC-0300]
MTVESKSVQSVLVGVKSQKDREWGKIALITVVVVYLGMVLFLPTLYVFMGAFSRGIGPFFATLTSRDFTQALRLTAMAVGIAVPFNVVFGLCAALVIARRRFPGRTLLLSIIDLPFSISPIVAGLMLVSLYGRNGLLDPLLQFLDIKIIFSFPGIALATMLGGMPFVAREVIPILEEVGTQEEEAAKTLGAGEWQIFWRVTLPSIRWGLFYGIILTTARAMGEYGAIAVVSSNLIGRTQTMTLYVEGAYRNYDSQGAFAASVVLAGLAGATLVIKEIFERRIRIKDQGDS